MEQTASPAPFLRQVQLLPGEALSSLLKRLEIANFVDSPSMFSAFCKEQLAKMGIRDNLSSPHKQQTYKLLSALTKLPIPALYQSTLHRFAPLLNYSQAETIPGISEGTQNRLARNERLNHFWPDTNIQYCPLCLRERLYYRLSWQPKMVSVCLKHKCFLHNRCMECGGRISVAAIVAGICSNCHSSLANFPPLQAREQSLGMAAQHSLQFWLGLVDPPLDSPWKILVQPPKVLYQFLQTQFQFLTRLTDWEYFYWSVELPLGSDPLSFWTVRTMTPASFYIFYTTAFKGLVDWPYGLLEFMENYQAYARSRSSRDPQYFLIRWLNSWESSSIWKSIQDVYSQFICKAQTSQTNTLLQNPEMISRFVYMSIPTAAKYLDTREETIHHLVEKNQITAFCSDQPAQEITWVKRCDVENVRFWFRSGDTLKEVSKTLGVPITVVLELVDMGLLETVLFFHPIRNNDLLLFRRQTVREFREHCLLAAKVMSYEIFLDHLDLLAAAQTLTDLGITPARLIRDVAEGSFTAYLYSGDEERLDQLLFLCKDLQARGAHLMAKQNWLNQDETAQLLGVSPTIALRWIRSELLIPAKVYAGTSYFDSERVQLFFDEYLWSEQAAQYAGISKKTLGDWISQKVIRPVSGKTVDGCQRWLIRRRDLDALSPKGRRMPD